MHKRPSLQEALQVLRNLSTFSIDCVEVLEEYADLKSQGQEFLAARLVVDSVDHFYHLQGVANG